MSFYSSLRQKWQIARQDRPWLLPVIVIVLLALVVGGVIASRRGTETTEPEKALPQITSVSLQDLVQGARITQTATFEAAVSAPLLSRTGGRVTALQAHLGDRVGAGTVIAQIDGGVEANIGRVQAEGAAEALQVFSRIERQAIATADTSITIAETNFTAAQSGAPLSTELAAKSRSLADVAVEQARLSFLDAQEIGLDAVVRTADIALKNARLAQDQATLSRQLAGQQSATNQKLSAENLEIARIGKQKLIADLAAQRVGLQTQLNVAREQVRLAQITAPLAGEVTNLQVAVGDFITPGQIIGEVNALAGARVRLAVSGGVREQLSEGQTVPITYGAQRFEGTITSLASTAGGTSALWQVEVLVTSTPEPLQPGVIVTVELPVAPAQAHHVFIPFDVTTVRQGGVVIFTLSPDDIVHEQAIEVVGYEGEYVEAIVDLVPETQIVTKNNRNLRDGDQVTRQAS